MENLTKLPKEELRARKAQYLEEFRAYQARNLSLDMSRGSPAPAQLDLSMGLLDAVPSQGDIKAENGIDIRNYGALEGIPEARRLMAGILEAAPENVILGCASSLNLMYDCVVRAMLMGVYGGKQPWARQGEVKFLCPVPGYDRHFAICEALGIKMVNVEMDDDGPDMDEVERLVNGDPAVKGIWCVPKYSNPGGVVYSDEVVRRFANLKPAADDFRIFWDNAYAVHDFYPGRAPKLLNLLEACAQAGTQDMAYVFTSTSKISFAGSGLSALAASPNNIALIKRQMGVQTIGNDKINQLRHARFYKDTAGILAHMARMADIVRPKFEAVLQVFEEELGGSGVAAWSKPVGGYFISVDSLPGSARLIVALCKEGGVRLTDAGAAFPYHMDPNDTNIRIAPTKPGLEELTTAARLFCLCVKLVAVSKLLEQA